MVYIKSLISQWAGLAQTIQRHAMGWTVRGPIPGRGDDIRTRIDRRWGSTTLLYIRKWVFYPGVKQPERGANQLTPTRVEH